jgi:hypothetical protein
MTYVILLAWSVVATLCALLATILHFRNPLPIPDKGHRLYGVKDERALGVVVQVLQQVSHLREQFTFDSGPTHQTLMWDGFTVISYIDQDTRKMFDLAGTGLSVPVENPEQASAKAVRLLRQFGYDAEKLDNLDLDLPANHLIPVKSNAFDGWVLVFRRPLIKMPMPRKRTKRFEVS